MQRRALLVTLAASIAGCNSATPPPSDTEPLSPARTETNTPEPTEVDDGPIESVTGEWPTHLGSSSRLGRVPTPPVLDDQRWSRSLSGITTSPPAQPVVHRNLVVQTRGRSLTALDATTGEQQWQWSVPDGEHVRGSVTAHADSLFVSTADAVYRLRADGGEQEQFYRPDTGSVSTAPTSVDGSIAVGIDVADADRFVFLDATTSPIVETLVEVVGTPRNAAAFDDRVFVRTTDAIVALDRGSESPRWTNTLISGAHSGDVPLATADTVLTGTGDGAVAALDPETGEQRWRRSIEGTHAFSPTAEGSTAYITDTDGRLYAMDEETGGVLASVRPDAGADLPGVAAADIDGSPVISASSVSFVAPDGVLVEVSRDDSLSTVERHRRLDRRLAAPPAVVNGAVFASAVPTTHGFSL